MLRVFLVMCTVGILSGCWVSPQQYIVKVEGADYAAFVGVWEGVDEGKDQSPPTTWTIKEIAAPEFLMTLHSEEDGDPVMHLFAQPGADGRWSMLALKPDDKTDDRCKGTLCYEQAFIQIQQGKVFILKHDSKKMTAALEANGLKVEPAGSYYEKFLGKPADIRQAMDTFMSDPTNFEFDGGNYLVKVGP